MTLGPAAPTEKAHCVPADNGRGAQLAAAGRRRWRRATLGERPQRRMCEDAGASGRASITSSGLIFPSMIIFYYFLHFICPSELGIVSQSGQ
eukprot:6197673-Pleurochrysis_carterae.AAC.2